jgi:uncharacterized protein (TIGR03435 family)
MGIAHRIRSNAPLTLKWYGDFGAGMGKWISDPMTWAPRKTSLYACMSLLLLCAIPAAMAQGAFPAGHASRRPAAQELRPSERVHISPSALAPGSTSMQVGADSWSARGFDLKSLIAQIFEVDVRRVDFPDEAAAAARYDVTLSLTDDDGPEAVQVLLREALEKKFGLAITTQTRAMEVYVLTAPNGPGPALHLHRAPTRQGNSLMKLTSFDESDSASDDPQQITYVGKDCSGVGSGGISVVAASISDFGRTLEPDLDRLLVDDTHLTGSYDFRIGSYRNQQELFQLMHDQLGLVVAPAQRTVTVLAVRAS